MWVVDKDRSTFEWLSADFESVQWCPDAESFLMRVRETAERDVVVAEARLPGMGGLELIEALRARGIGIPVVVVCADADIAIAVNAIRSGAADFFEKPVPRNLLIGCIKRLADQRG